VSLKDRQERMTFLRSTLLSISLLPALATGLAQQPATKPVTPAPAINHPATSSSTVPAVHPANVGPSYVIGAEDSLQITVWEEPNLSETVLVRPDGKITMPLLNDIAAAGLTPAQLADDIKARLKQYVTTPLVDVVLLASKSKRVFMMGEISHVGPIDITPGMSILQAIATAGGLTPYANKKKIYILRGEAGHQQKIPFDYTRAVNNGDMQGLTLVPGDTIVVP
jgi:polysaccharide biosynthesis/export protein